MEAITTIIVRGLLVGRDGCNPITVAVEMRNGVLCDAGVPVSYRPHAGGPISGWGDLDTERTVCLAACGSAYQIAVSPKEYGDAARLLARSSVCPPRTIADYAADEMGGDGQVWESPSGLPLADVCAAWAARAEYGVRVPDLDDPRGYRLEAGAFGDWLSGDTIRYEFPDGSAIVAAGEAWDIEGSTPFSWAGAE